MCGLSLNFITKNLLLVLCSIVLLFSCLGWSQVTFSYRNGGNTQISEELIYYMEDHTALLSIEDVVQNDHSIGFQHLTIQEIPRHSSYPLWTKVYIKNESVIAEPLVLQRTLGSDDVIEYYVYQQSALLQMHTSGSSVPYEQRVIPDKNGLTFIAPPDETLIIYARIFNDHLFRGGYTLTTQSDYETSKQTENQWYVLLIGIFMGVVVVNVIVAAIFREVRFVLYLAGLALFVVSLIIYSGKDYLFLPYISGGWSDKLVFIQSFIGIFFLGFTALFFERYDRYRKLYYIGVGFASVWFICALLGLSSLRPYFFYPLLVIGSSTYVAITAVGVLQLRQNVYDATRFLMSISVFVALNLYYLGLVIGMFPYGEFNNAWVVLFIVLQSIAFSFNMIQKDIRDSVQSANKRYLLSKQKQMFLKNISHELRTPINGVVGAIELLLRTKKTPHQHELLDSADQAMQKIMSVVNDFVEVAISDGEFLAIKKDSYDLIKELNGTIDSLEKLAIVKGLRFEKLLPRTVQHLMIGDPKRVMFLMSRLITLSIKYTSHGFVKLICDIDNEDDDKVEIHFIIQDSGTSPAGEFLSITEKGINAGESEVKMAENYLFVQLIELIGARVWYNALEFNGDVIGTEYHMVIEQGVGGVCELKTHSEKHKPLSAKGLNILVAEDDLVNQKIIAKVLENMNHTYKIVGNGSECVKEWLKNKYDIILMDIQMPIMNGYEAALEIRLKEKMAAEFKHIPIIALSAREEQYMYSECKRNGINSYIPKPFKLSQLEKEIGQFFKI